ncbi:MAG: caspase family protein [Planctomycetes bacterium]|nr:caspase family protein [Planctomycetota bacterium]
MKAFLAAGVVLGWSFLGIDTASAQSPGAGEATVPADTCVLDLSVPPRTQVTVDGRAQGEKRPVTWTGLSRGKVYVSTVDLRFAGGATERHSILVEAGRRLRLARQDPHVIRPQLVLQTGHSKYVYAAVFSPDGQSLATASDDHRVMIWDAATGRKLREVILAESVRGVAFSKDSQSVYAVSGRKISGWDMASGKLQLEVSPNYVTARTEPYSSVAASSTGHYVVACGGKGGADVGDTRTRSLMRSLRLYPDDTAYICGYQSVAFRPASTQVLVQVTSQESMKTAGYTLTYEMISERIARGENVDVDQLFKEAARQQDEYKKKHKEWSLLVQWDAVTGERLQTYQIEGKQFVSFDLSSDGRYLAALSRVAKSFDSRNPTLVLYDLETRREVARTTVDGNCERLQFSSDSQSVLAYQWDGPGFVRRYDLPGLLAAGNVCEFRRIYYLGAAADFRRTLTVEDDKYSLACWLPSAKQPAWTTESHVAASMTFYPGDARALDTTANDVLLIDAATQRLVRTLYVKDESHWLHSAEFNPGLGWAVVNTTHWTVVDGKNSPSYEAVVVDGQTGEEVAKIRAPSRDDYWRRLTLSRDGQWALLSNVNADAVVWDTATGRVVGRYKPLFKGQQEGVGDGIFFPDGKRVLVGSTGMNLPNLNNTHPAGFLWDPATGDSRPTLTLPAELTICTARSMDYNSDRQLLVTVGTAIAAGTDAANSPHLRYCVWDGTGSYVRSFSIHAANHTPSTHATPLISPDGRLLVLNYLEGSSEPRGCEVRLLDTGSLLRKYSGKIESFAFTDRVASLADGTGATVLVDLSTGAEVVRVLRPGKSDWVAVTPEGLFDGTEKARQLVAYRVGDSSELVPVDRFFQDFYRPGLLSAVVGGRRPMPEADFARAAPPRVRIVSPKEGGIVESPRVTLEIEATDRGGGIQGPWLRHNGARVASATESQRLDKALRRQFSVQLVEGENRLEAWSATSDGSWESEPAAIVLRYEKLFQRRGGALYRQVSVHPLPDEKATRSAIQQSLEKIAKESQPQDTLVVFLAGHGTMVGQRYYFIPHEFRRQEGKTLEEDVRRQALPVDELGDQLSMVPALKRVVVFDTCQSGGAIGLSRTARDAFAFRGAIERLSRSQGVFTIGATAAGDEAQEVTELKHGVLTYALLAGLRAVDEGPLQGQGIRPSNPDQVADVLDWFSFASGQVPRLTKQYFGRSQDVQTSGLGSSFPILPLKDPE